MSQETHQKIQILGANGKSYDLSFQAWGNPQGKPILYFHGFPGSHKQAKFLDADIRSQNIYLVAIDRPGYGESDLNLSIEVKISEIAVQLMDHLKIKKMSVLGISGGAPSAWQVAFDYPERVHRLGVVCGLSSFSKDFHEDFPKHYYYGLKFFQSIPRTQFLKIINFLIKPGPPKMRLKLIKKLLPESDRKLFSDEILLKISMDSMTWARQQRGHGIVNDLQNFGRDWWQQKQIQVPTYLWHGEQDRIVPSSMSKKWKQLLPQVQLQLFPEEGHYSLPVNKKSEIIAKISEGLDSI